RHTRSKRDWSSDVCSSDLGEPVGAFQGGELTDGQRAGIHPEPAGGELTQDVVQVQVQVAQVGLALAVPGLGSIHLLQRRGAQREIGRASCREMMSACAQSK